MKQLLLFLIVGYALLANESSAQCTGGTLASNLTPGVTWSTTGTTAVAAGKYYTFTATAGFVYYFSFCAADGGNATWDTQITILNNAGTYVGAGGFSDDNCGLQSYLAWTCVTTGTYRVLITKYSCTTGATGATMSYKYSAPLSCPSNLGTGNVAIASLPYSSGAGTTCGAGNDLTSVNTNPCGSTFYLDGEDKVFIFTPASTGTVTITLNAPSASYTALNLYNGCPLTGQPGTCVANSQSSTGSKTLTVCLQAGTTYYLILDTWPAPSCVPFNDLTISAPVPAGACATGNGTVNVASLPYTSNSRTTCGKTDDFTTTNTIACGSTFYNGAEDEVFIFTPSTSGQTTISLTSASSWVGITLFDGCPLVTSCSGTAGTCVAFAQSSAGSQSMCVNVIAGHTYYLVVDQFPSPYCIPSYNISISAPVGMLPGAICSNAVNISGLPFSAANETTACMGNDYTNASIGSCGTLYESGEDKVYRYVASGPECISITLSQASDNLIGYQVYSGCPGNAGTNCIGNNSGALSGTLNGSVVLPAAGTYFIIVDTWAPPTSVTYDISIQSFGSGAANDLPCNATPLPIGVYLNGSNNCSGLAGEPSNPSCWSAGSRNTVWHSFVAPPSGQVTIRTVPGSLRNSQIALYQGTCGASMTLLACNDDAPSCGTTINYMSQINYSGLTAGTTYYVVVDGYNNETGSYGIIIVSGPPANIPPVFGQECSVPNPVCNQIISIGDPGYQAFGSSCDFPGSGSNCLLSAERGSAWYEINIQNAGVLAFNIIPNDYVAGLPGNETDYDFAIWKMKDGPTNNTVNTCATLASGAAPIRCNYSYLGVTGLNSTVTNQAPAPYTPDYNAAYDAQINVAAGDVYQLVVSNFSNSTSGFTMNFLSSPVNFTPNPGFVVWSGGVDNDWFKAPNWGGCQIPNCTVDAIIPPSSANMPIINAAGASCKSITINPSASLSINAGFSLQVCQDYNNNGTLNAANGSNVYFNNASVNQSLNGNMVGASAFANVVVSKTGGIVTLGQNADMKGNFIITSSTSNFNANAKTHRVGGDFLNYGTYTPGIGGTLELYGTAAQNYLNNGVLNNLSMNHSGTGVTLLSNATLGNNGMLSLTNGKIITNLFEVKVNNRNSGAVTPGNINSFIQGNLRRYLNTQGSYDFPVGHATAGYQRMNINFNVPGSPTTIDNLLSFFNTYSVIPAGIGATECSVVYSQPALDNGYWSFTASNSPLSGTYDATAYNLNYSNPFMGWTIMRNHGAGWNLFNGICINSPVTAVNRVAMNGFGTGTELFGITQANNPLPVELIAFNASPLVNSIMVAWSTASEINSDYFELQRSTNGIEFTTIANITSQGNSNVVSDYKFEDKDVVKNTIYFYRLKQVDKNGSYVYTEIRNAKIDDDSNIFVITPNPYKNETNFVIFLNSNADVSIEVINVIGEVVSTQINEKLEKGMHQYTFSAKKLGLPAGIYNVKLNINGVITSKNMIELE